MEEESIKQYKIGEDIGIIIDDDEIENIEFIPIEQLKQDLTEYINSINLIDEENVLERLDWLLKIISMDKSNVDRVENVFWKLFEYIPPELIIDFIPLIGSDNDCIRFSVCKLFKELIKKNEVMETLLENGIMDHIIGNISSMAVMKLCAKLICNHEADMAFFQANMFEGIGKQLSKETDQESIVSLLKLFKGSMKYYIKMDYEEIFLHIFTLVNSLIKHENSSISKEARKAMLYFVKASDVFARFFLESDMLPPYIEETIYDPKAIKTGIQICITLSKLDADGVDYMVTRKIFEFIDCAWYFGDQKVRAIVIKLIKNILWVYPESIEIIWKMNFICMVSDIAGNDTTQGSLRLEALRCITIFSKALEQIPEENRKIYFHEMYSCRSYFYLIRYRELLYEKDWEYFIDALLLITKMHADSEASVIFNRLCHLNMKEFLELLMDKGSRIVYEKTLVLYEFIPWNEIVCDEEEEYNYEEEEYPEYYSDSS